MNELEIKDLIDQAVYAALADGLKTGFTMYSDFYDDWLVRQVEPLNTRLDGLSGCSVENVEPCDEYEIEFE